MKRLTSLLLSCAIILNAMLFFSCQAEEKAEPEKRENLSHYKRSTVSLPYGESMTDIPPYYDPNSTELTVITNVRNEIFDIDEETEEAVFVRYDYDYFAVKLNYELDTVSHIELETDGSALITSYLTDSSLYTLVLDSVKTSLDCYSLTDGKRASSVPLEYQPAEVLCSLAVDADGYVYIADSDGITVLSADGTLVSEISLPYDRTTLALSPDGNVFIGAEFDEGFGVAQLGLAKKAYGNFTEYDDCPNGIFFVGAVMYVSTSGGFYRVDEESITQLMACLSEGMNASETMIVAASSDERFFTIMYNYAGEIPGYILSVNDKAEEELEAENVIDICTLTDFNAENLTRKLNKFTQSGKARMKITNYGEYADGSKMDGAAAERLVMDIVSGVYQPDIIVTSPRLTELNNYIVKNELFVDYNELFAREDSLIKEEDVFECVKKTFSDKSGRMWGMTDVFWVYTMLMNKKYMLDKTTWTVDDMMDINDALPDGVIMNEHFSKKTFTRYFISTGAYFTQFVDMENRQCNFDNATFYRYLEFINSLPDEPVRFDDKYYDSGNRYPAYMLLGQDGKTASSDSMLSNLRQWKLYDLEFPGEYEFTGYPTVRSEKSYTYYSDAFIITSFCGDIDSAWEFVHYLLTIDLKKKPEEMSIMGLATYMPLMENQIEGTLHFQSMISEYPKEMDRYLPEIVITRDDCNDVVNFLNTQVAGSVYNLISPEITAIITEEISYYVGGVGTAEECAKKIQSRASIWLSENE